MLHQTGDYYSTIDPSLGGLVAAALWAIFAVIVMVGILKWMSKKP